MRPRTKVVHRRLLLMIGVIVMLIVSVMIAWSNALNRVGPSNAGRVASSPSSPFCRKGDPMAGVYNPLRFRVLSSCESEGGTVSSITPQTDGSVWVDVDVGASYSKLIGAGNINTQNGLLVLERPAGYSIDLPLIGERISFVGPLVYDTENQFNAICPIWSITLS